MEQDQQKANQLIKQGNQFFSEKLWAQAAQYYEQAITLNNCYPFYLVVGDCYFNNRDYKAAENAFRCLLDFTPEHDQGWWRLGRTVMMQNRFQEAEEFYEKAIALNTQDVEPYYYGAQMKHLNDKKEEVLALLKKALEIRPDWSQYALEDPLLKEYVN